MVSRPNDKYEREADSVADKVTNGNRVDAVSQQPAISAVQKAELKEEEKSVQKAEEKKEEEKPVQKAEDKKEEESAVQKAEEKKEEETPVQKAEEKKEEETPVQKAEEKKEEEAIQKAEEEKKEEETIQKKASDEDGRSGSYFVQQELKRGNSNGVPLPMEIRALMEQGMGAGFGNVRIHTGTQAANMNKAIGAKAFTHGSDIYFKDGYYDTGSQPGRHLLAHELTHVVQQHGGSKGNSAAPAETGTVHRELERDPVTGNPTGNYLFRVGPAISAEFLRRFKNYVSDGSLTDDELNRLRLYGIAQRGTVTQAERLLMAAGLEPANHPIIAAHNTGDLSIPNANITSDNRDHVSNIGRGTLDTAYVQMLIQALVALFSGNFDEAVAQFANINETAIQEIMTIGGRSWRNQAENLVAFIEMHDLQPLVVLNAMYNAASDSSTGDQVMAGIVYATAAQAGHGMAANLASGALKVDALIPSALQRLTNNSGVDAFYSAASLNDRVKSDTLYVPTTLDIMNLPARALIIHELTHGAQDAAATGLTVGPQIDMEIPAYRAQVAYVMDQLLATPADALDAEVFSVRHLSEIALFQWAFIVETQTDRARYEAIAKRILLQSPSVSETDIDNALALPQADALLRLRNAILSMPQYGGNPNAARDGLRGESILDNIN
jgi:outer membrane biosynthesis protein TonB